MPPKKRAPQKKQREEAAEEEVNFGSELVTLDLEAKATNKLELDKLINHLWSQNLICAEVERGKPATATTPWNDCTRWRCLCTKVEQGKKRSCNDAKKWYRRTKNWVHDTNVNKAVEQHFQTQHYDIWLDANPITVAFDTTGIRARLCQDCCCACSMPSLTHERRLRAWRAA